MLCQRCGEREASVHLTKIVNNEKTELYLCEECARETGQIPFNGSDPFSFQNLLAGILKPGMGSYDDYRKKQECERCGLSYQDFTQQGLVGCAECYQTFSDKLIPLFKRIHGSVQHNGKVPKRRGGTLRVKREIARLREELQQEVSRENFERAAELRDQIYDLETRLGGE